MRIAFTIALTNCAKIPTTYRKNFVALFKEAFKHSGSEDLITMNSSSQQKPFTFSVSFDAKSSSAGHIELGHKEIDLYFSTNDYAVLMAIYNSLLHLANNYSIFGSNSKNHLVSARLLNEREINSPKVIFKTLSPIIVRDMANKDGDKTLGFDEGGFIENLKLSIKSTIRSFLKEELDPNSISIDVQMKRDPIISYGNGKRNYGVIGNSGFIEIAAKPEYLQLLYDIGIGAKRSQGFGMVEVMG